MRAASTPCTESGISNPAGSSSAFHPPFERSRTPWSIRVATSSSTKNGFPPARSTSAVRTGSGRSTASSPETISSVWVSVNGSSPSSVTFRFPPPQAGRTSRISGRDVAMRNSGPVTSASSRSTRSSSSSSAQCEIFDEQDERTLGGELLEEAGGRLLQPVASDEGMEA